MSQNPRTLSETWTILLDGSCRRTVRFDVLLNDPEVRALFEAEIEQRSTGFKRFERIMAFGFVKEPFSSAGGLLTPTLKIKRAKVFERYQAQLDELYERIPKRVQTDLPSARAQ